MAFVTAGKSASEESAQSLARHQREKGAFCYELEERISMADFAVRAFCLFECLLHRESERNEIEKKRSVMLKSKTIASSAVQELV